MLLIILGIFGIFLFGSEIKNSKNKMDYYNKILWTIYFVFFTFCKITDYRGILGKIIFIVLFAFIIITHVCSKLKRYKE
ncbi:hypothetical protein [Terrisporobacter mayombei]|uniref:Uncharacterized protein n=1 Tax=Terrisporobacter mayombei TaxID=1541 RepID=A0ABY9Q0M5_9FIRM|nr:hypothetical protein [Terrisporobacter mayombei]MCC3866601.1 hypothetical protein [Terrisporobacter mayombei]WMT80835.1 hypothetical protein TEMA_11570 [Terrisporobacter mayombei]